MRALIASLFALPQFLFAQDTKVIEIENKNQGTTEVYHVLKGNPVVKHGLYEEWRGKTLLLSCHYSHNVLDGAYTSYGWGGKIDSKGNYKMGFRKGVWDIYTQDGKLEIQYDYDLKKIVYYNPPFSIYTCNSPDTAGKTVPAGYAEGQFGLYNWISKHTMYPNKALDFGIEGTVMVGFTVGADSVVRNIKVIKPIDADLDKEALRVVTGMPRKWIPASQNGKPIDCDYVIPIAFKQY